MNNLEDFIRDRIIGLRLQKNVSESLMSRELGHSSTYLSNLNNRHQVPSLRSLLDICDDFEITLFQFFDETLSDPIQVNRVCQLAREADEDTLQLVIQLLEKLNRRSSAD